MEGIRLSCACLLLCCAVSAVLSQGGPPVGRRFQYKQSFKGPQLAGNDGQVPYWTVEGDAIAGEESLRVVPSLKSKRGRASCKTDVTFRNWEVDFVFRITGRGRLGADGLAFWYVSTQLTDGTVFGAADRWQGLGIFFDSYDNDGLQNNPIVMGIVNDGTKEYDHKNDGGKQGVGQCIRDFRNKPHPIRARITYLDQVLTVFINQGLTAPDPKDPNNGYELCFRADNVYLPLPGHFGVSAATGGLADDHDVLAFLVHELVKADGTATPPPSPDAAMSEEERARLAQKYEQLNEETQKLRDEYKKEHPDKPTSEETEAEEAAEDWAQRELRNIYQSQGVVLRTLQAVDRKLDEMYGRQEQLARSIYQIAQAPPQQQGMPQQAGMPPPQQGIGMDGAGIKRQEVDQLLNTQRELMTEITHMKASLYQVSQMQQSMQMGQQQPGGGPQLQAGLAEMRDSIVGVRRVVDQLAARPLPVAPTPAAPVACPVPNCLTPAYFIVFIIAQFCLFVGYILFKSRHEKPKFY